jgi:cell division protein FtsL
MVSIVSVAAVALVVFSVVAGQVLLAQAGYSKASAERELDAARADYERARLEEAQAKLPQDVEHRARTEMGLQDSQGEEPLAMGPTQPIPSPSPSESAASQQP